jgi:hypothetical protein
MPISTATPSRCSAGKVSSRALLLATS